MNIATKYLVMGSTLALASFLSASTYGAEQKPNAAVEDNCVNDPECDASGAASQEKAKATRRKESQDDQMEGSAGPDKDEGRLKNSNSGDEMNSTKRKHKSADDQMEGSAGPDQDKSRTKKSHSSDEMNGTSQSNTSRTQQANKNWHYDSKRHHRSHNKDSRYKYYYGGYWYVEPYWAVTTYGDRVSCSEGRDIVDENGFNRVRTIECSGKMYTYAARQRGESFRVLLNSRTGEIVSVRPL